MLFLAMIFFLACIISIVAMIICVAKKKPFKKQFLSIGVSFLAFVVCCINAPDTKSSTNTKNETLATQKQVVVSNNNSTKRNAEKSVVKVENKTTATKPNAIQNLGNLKIHYINVNQADSILVEQDKHFMLIDAGTNECEKLVVDYLKKQGVTKLDYAVGTHPHADHIGGLDKVIDNFNVGTLLMPKKISNTKTFKDVLTSAKNKGLKVTQPVIGTNYNLGKAVFTVLAPKNHDYQSTNNYSIVQKLKFGNTSFIFTGDAEAISEMEMVNANADLKADVLKVGHHGSKTSTCQAFLDKVNPKYAVISCGKDNKYHHPNKSTMDRLKAKNIKVYRTDESGNIIATSNGKDITFNCKEGTYNFRDNGNSTVKKAIIPVVKPSVKPKTSVISNNNLIRKSTHSTKKVQKKHNTQKQVKHNSRQVWLSATGSKYHSRPDCGRMNPNTARKVSIEEARMGYDPCSKCM